VIDAFAAVVPALLGGPLLLAISSHPKSSMVISNPANNPEDCAGHFIFCVDDVHKAGPVVRPGENGISLESHSRRCIGRIRNRFWFLTSSARDRRSAVAGRIRTVLTAETLPTRSRGEFPGRNV
jgi:hypothetical protein